LGADIETIGESAFLFCPELNNVTILRENPSTLTLEGNPSNCFTDCPNLKIYVLGKEMQFYRSCWRSYAREGGWGEDGDINLIIRAL
jgi:hypothetical protein